MAARDIMPFISNQNSHRQDGLADAAATFLVGEPVQIEADGQIIEAATQPIIDGDPPGAVGIAAVSAASITVVQGTLTNQHVPYYPFDYETEWVSRNLFSGSDTLVVPLATHVGDAVSLRRTAGDVWGFDIAGAATTESFVILRVLNTDGRDLGRSGGTGVTVIAKRTRFDAV